MSEVDTGTVEESGHEPEVSVRLQKGVMDVKVLQGYLDTLTPDHARAAIDLLMRRALDVEFDDGEEEEIVNAVIFDGHYKRDVKVGGKMKLTVWSLDERAFQRSIKADKMDAESQEHHDRLQNLNLIAEAVLAVNGQSLSDDTAERKEYWSRRPFQLVTMVSDVVRLFNRKVNVALSKAELLKK